MRIPVVSGWFEARRAHREAEEVAAVEQARRARLRKQADTEQRARRLVTDTMLEDVDATTRQMSGVAPPKSGPNGRKP